MQISSVHAKTMPQRVSGEKYPTKAKLGENYPAIYFYSSLSSKNLMKNLFYLISTVLYHRKFKDFEIFHIFL